MKIIIFLFSLVYYSFANSCYSAKTKIGIKTLVSPLYLKGSYQEKHCTIFNSSPRLYKNNYAYVGCYNKKKTAQWVLKNINFPFKNAKIVYHKVSLTDPYIIVPRKSNLTLNGVKKRLNYVYKNYTINRVLKLFPRYFYGNGIKIVNLRKITFLPSTYIYYSKYKKDKALILYDGVYSLEMLYKKLHNPKYIKRIDKNIYEIKIPIIISSTASLVIQNKTVHLLAVPNSMFIASFGKLYAKHSKFLVWDAKHNRYLPREKIPKDKLLYLGYEKPRPFFVGFSGSKTYFVDNIFRGLGFHNVSATFGISLFYYPNSNFVQSISKGFKFFLSKLSHPQGIFIGNDIYEGCMAFYTNSAYNSIFLGNYTHDNVVYNFDPHDYSKNLVIARNFSSNAGHAHGIIVSREVDNSIIAENISMKNHSNGIMLDRFSNNNYIYKNLSIENGFMGASLQESKNNLIINNILSLNNLDGLMIRNSLQTEVINNKIESNGKNGVEVQYKNIDNIPGRDFAKDPYTKASSAVLERNKIFNNLNKNIVVKNSAAIKMKNNILKGLNNYEGDINFFLKDIYQKKGNFKLYGRGFPFKRVSTDTIKLNPYAFEIAKSIFIDISKTGNKYIGEILGKSYLHKRKNKLGELQLKRASSTFSNGALKYLGYLYLAKAQTNQYKNKKKMIEGFSYIIESAILKNLAHMANIEEFKYFIPHSENLIQKAFEIAITRMQNGKIFPKKAYKTSVICKNSLEKKYKIKSAIKLFLYKMHLIHARNFLQYCKMIDKDFTALTLENIQNIKKNFSRGNNKKDAYNDFIKNQQKKALKCKFCIRYLNKQKYQNKQTNNILSSKEEKNIKILLPKIKNTLKEINKYRVRKISLDEVLRILKKPAGSRYEFYY